MSHSIPQSSSVVNLSHSNDKKITRQDVTLENRRLQNRDAKRRQRAGVKQEKRQSYVGRLNKIQLAQYILFITQGGTRSKRTSLHFIAQDHNKNLRSPDEKQISPRTAERWLSDLKKITIGTNPLIKVELLPAYNMRLLISIPCKASFIRWLAIQEKEYRDLRKRSVSKNAGQCQQKCGDISIRSITRVIYDPNNSVDNSKKATSIANKVSAKFPKSFSSHERRMILFNFALRMLNESHNDRKAHDPYGLVMTKTMAYASKFLPEQKKMDKFTCLPPPQALSDTLKNSVVMHLDSIKKMLR